MASHTWQRIVIAAGAAASIATSQAPDGWHKQQEFLLGDQVFDEQRIKVVYAVHAEISGTAPYKDLDGFLTAHLTFTEASSVTTASELRVTWKSITNGNETVELVKLDARELYADIGVFEHCALPPCAEDFELTVELVNAAGARAFVQGGIDLGAGGRAEDGSYYKIEQATQLVLDVTPL